MLASVALSALGGTSIDGTRTLLGTIGQPDAGGPLTNSQYSIVGGLWSLPTLVQSPLVPTLHITNAVPGFSTIWWTPPTSRFTLQSAESPSPANWVNALSGISNPATILATLPGRFYRLFKP